MNRLFPIKNRKTFAILLNDGNLFTYDDGNVATGTKTYLNMLMDSVPRDFTEAKIVQVKPAIARVKNKA